ncbi:hypothetical protein DFH09DRAFT_1092028 [Mycena vulgaris]|nr:hypothetical protein DFH09DRAFT_1092028 [Mycena vulgaris]
MPLTDLKACPAIPRTLAVVSERGFIGPDVLTVDFHFLGGGVGASAQGGCMIVMGSCIAARAHAVPQWLAGAGECAQDSSASSGGEWGRGCAQVRDRLVPEWARERTLPGVEERGRVMGDEAFHGDVASWVRAALATEARIVRARCALVLSASRLDPENGARWTARMWRASDRGGRRRRGARWAPCARCGRPRIGGRVQGVSRSSSVHEGDAEAPDDVTGACPPSEQRKRCTGRGVHRLRAVGMSSLGLVDPCAAACSYLLWRKFPRRRAGVTDAVQRWLRASFYVSGRRDVVPSELLWSRQVTYLLIEDGLLDSAILPALRLAKTGATGIGIPGVEPMISGVLELATMLSTMKANRDGLSTLETSLKQLIAINASGAGGDLKQRLTTLTSELKIIVLECKSLTEKSRLKQFFKSKDYKDRIQNIKTSIASHIYEFTFYGNISIEKSVETMASNVRVIDEKMNNLLVKEVLAKLKCVPARYNAANTPDKCMDGTRVDIIKDIVMRLIAAPNSSERVVMLSGPAGSGKSTIAKSVASILAEEKGILAASFFFSRDHAERNEIQYLASTLAMQLAEYNAVFKASLVDLLEADRTGILDAEPRLQFHKMVVQILERLPPIASPWVICLDALDECGQDHGQNFLRWLSDSIARIPAHIRFFLTGRPDVPPYLKLDTLRSLMHGIVLNEIDIQIVSRDIRLYVERSLDGANWTTRHSWKIQNHDVEEITTRANGLFVFAATTDCLRCHHRNLLNISWVMRLSHHLTQGTVVHKPLMIEL